MRVKIKFSKAKNISEVNVKLRGQSKNIKEKKDQSGNTILSGEIKNVGAQRADFAKINVTFRKNWHGDTETLTSFSRGTYYTFKTGITSDSSILPGAIAEFELVVPKSTGAFIGYSYTLDWEQYD